MNRWSVEADWDYDFGQYVWLAGGPDTKLEEFLTWREAMDYADKKARTVEVVLPRGRKTEIKSQEPWDGFEDMTTDSFGEYLTIYWPDDWLIIAPYECKPLALALLAHHYKQEAKK